MIHGLGPANHQLSTLPYKKACFSMDQGASSSLSSSKPSCCLSFWSGIGNYFKQFALRFVGIFGAFWEFFQVLFCCKIIPSIDWENGWKLPIGERASNLTDEEKKRTFFVMATVCYLDALSVASKSIELQEEGNKLKPVHPLDSFTYIFKNPTLKKAISYFANSGDGIVWSHYCSGLNESFEKAKKKPDDYGLRLERFVLTFKLNKANTSELINKKDWKSFINLIAN